MSAFRRIKWSATIGGRRPFGMDHIMDHMVCDEDKRKVTDFYESDEMSRLCSGRRDVKTVRDADGRKQAVQKRLVLGSLRELYREFKRVTDSPAIGFSTFASLRPPHCVLAGSAGTHSVCVCLYHQNPKLQAAALGIPSLTVNELMEKSVCDMGKRECMMHACKECPRDRGVTEFLYGLRTVADQEHVDRCGSTCG